MRSILILIATVAFVAYLAGSLVADIGELRPAFKVAAEHPIIFVISCITLFVAGYATRKYQDN